MEIINFEDAESIEFKIESVLTDDKSTHYVDGSLLYNELRLFSEAAQAVKAQHPDQKVSEVFPIFPKVSDFLSHSIIKICTNLGYRPNFYNYSYKDEMTGDAIINCLMYMYNFCPIKSKKHIKVVEDYLKENNLDWDTLDNWIEGTLPNEPKMWVVDVEGEETSLECTEIDDKGSRIKNMKLKLKDVVHYNGKKLVVYRAESAFNYLTMIASNTFVRKIKAERLVVYTKYKTIQRAGIVDKVETIGQDGEEHGLDFMENLRYYMKDIDAYAKVAEIEEAKIREKDEFKKLKKKERKKNKLNDSLDDYLE